MTPTELEDSGPAVSEAVKKLLGDVCDAAPPPGIYGCSDPLDTVRARPVEVVRRRRLADVKTTPSLYVEFEISGIPTDELVEAMAAALAKDPTILNNLVEGELLKEFGDETIAITMVEAEINKSIPTATPVVVCNERFTTAPTWQPTSASLSVGAPASGSKGGAGESSVKWPIIVITTTVCILLCLVVYVFKARRGKNNDWNGMLLDGQFDPNAEYQAGGGASENPDDGFRAVNGRNRAMSFPRALNNFEVLSGGAPQSGDSNNPNPNPVQNPNRGGLSNILHTAWGAAFHRRQWSWSKSGKHKQNQASLSVGTQNLGGVHRRVASTESNPGSSNAEFMAGEPSRSRSIPKIKIPAAHHRRQNYSRDQAVSPGSPSVMKLVSDGRQASRRSSFGLSESLASGDDALNEIFPYSGPSPEPVPSKQNVPKRLARAASTGALLLN